MTQRFFRPVFSAAALMAAASLLALAAEPPARRNIVVFVADGLRAASVNATDAPTLLRVRTEGVNFVNSHSVFPTVTMTNAAAIATGHYPGDTGQYANNLFVGRRIFASGNFARMPGTLTPNVEEDQTLGDIDAMFGGNYVGEASLLALARANGFNTASLGKIGPTAMQDVSQLAPVNGRFRTPTTVILDGATGTTVGVPVEAEIAKLIAEVHLSAAPPPRNQPFGSNTTPGTLVTNAEHYRWFADVATKVLLPKFVRSGKPFILVLWCGDPDQTQHAQGDSLNVLTPGINGPTSRAAVHAADDIFKQLLDYITADAALRDTTDIFVTADHGFSTVSRRDIDAAGHATTSYSARFVYKDAMGRQEVNTGFLPPGALAIDLAHALNLPLFASDVVVEDKTSGDRFVSIDPAAQVSASVRQHPVAGALLGGTGRVASLDAQIILAGSSLYVPRRDPALVAKIVAALAAQDYVGGLFVDDSYGAIPGALPLSAIGHAGATTLPVPAVVIAPREFALDPANALLTSVIIDGGTGLQHGQGNHGALARANTYNNMAAIGPDFKKGFVDQAPISNADIAPTLAKLMGLRISDKGMRHGRVLAEALIGGPARVATRRQVVRSNSAASGRATTLHYQQVGSIRYLDSACFERNGCAPVAGVTTTR